MYFLTQAVTLLKEGTIQDGGDVNETHSQLLPFTFALRSVYSYPASVYKRIALPTSGKLLSVVS